MFTVLVTGFGPFDTHAINSSWETAKYLSTLPWGQNDINLIINEIPVAYKSVLNIVPKLWSDLKPQLVVHMGVAACYNDIKIETIARKTGYQRADINGELPTIEYQSSEPCDTCIQPELDIKSICEKLNAQNNVVPVCASTNAGNYLCEFIYYISLSINPQNTVFIHVPPIDQPFSVRQMAEKVREIILLLVEEKRKSEQKAN